jgi:hypothetical protein
VPDQRDEAKGQSRRSKHVTAEVRTRRCYGHLFSIPFTQVFHEAGVRESYITAMGRECGCARHGLQASLVPGLLRFCFVPACGGQAKGWAILCFAFDQPPTIGLWRPALAVWRMTGKRKTRNQKLAKEEGTSTPRPRFQQRTWGTRQHLLK